MDKYITVGFPDMRDKDGFRRIAWWIPSDAPRIIEEVEKENPFYEFHQFVTSPGNGGYKEYIIMKLKT